MFKNTLLMAATAITLSGCITSATVKQNSTNVQALQQATKSGIFGISQSVDSIKVSGSESKLAGVREIILPFYRITFLEDSAYKNQVSSGMSATATVNATLEGVDDSIYGDVTNAAHKDLVKKLQAAGYKIIDHSNMSSVQSYASKAHYPKKSDQAVSHVAKGTTFEGTSSFSNPLLKVEMAEITNVMSVDLTANFVINNRNTKKFSLTEAKETVYTSQGANITGNFSGLF